MNTAIIEGTSLACLRRALAIELAGTLEALRVGDAAEGAPRDGGARPHTGLDLSARVGDPVVAPFEGHLTWQGWSCPSRPRRPRTDELEGKQRWRPREPTRTGA